MSTYVVSVLTPGGLYFLPYEEHEWIVEGGYHAPVQAWIAPQEIVATILSDLVGLTGSAREVTLQLGELGSELTISRVIVLGSSPAGDPQKRYLLLADVRWYFTREWLAADVNVRRRVGDKHLVGDSLLTASPVDTIAYAPWSIHTGSAYDWGDFKEHVLDYLTSARHGRPAVSWVLDTFTIIDPTFKIVQETTLDSPGHVACANAIESVPGASIYVDLEGTIHVYERTPGAESTLIAALPPDLLGHGDVVLADNSSLRPAASDHSWRIYVDYEIEVRFTYNFSGAGLWSTLSENDPFLIPVLQVTDASLAIPGGSYPGLGTIAGRVVAQGSWISQKEAFEAWGTAVYGSLTLPKLTDDIVANHWFGEGLDQYTAGQLVASFDPVWGNRIGELMRCYRTCFRVNPKFWDRVRHAWAIRAAVWDPITGQRAPAAVYQNYNLVPVDRWASAQIYQFGVDVLNSYVTSGLLADGTPSGFRAHIVDRELGIIEIDRNVLSRHPGAAKIGISPVKAPALLDDGIIDPRTQELVSATSGASTDWKLAVVMSCAPAAPNDLGRMYEIQVSLADAAATAGIPTPTAYGPDQELRSHLSQARIAWRDGDAVDTLKMFGSDDLIAQISTDDPVTTLDPINLQQELKPLAKALAAANLLRNLDHYVGERAVPIDGNIAPIGSLTRVVHKVVENRAVTVVHCTRYPVEFRAIDFLQGTARQFLLHELPNQQR